MHKTILVTVNSSWNIVNFRMPLLAMLKSKGFDPVVLVPEGEHQRTIQEAGYKVITLPLSATSINPIKDIKCLLFYYRTMRRLRPIAMLTFTIKPALYGCLAGYIADIPIIVIITGLGATFIKKNWISSIVNKLYKLSLPKAFRVIFQNPDDRNLFLERGYTTVEKSEVILGSGVNTTYFSKTALPKDIKAPVFLLIARLLKDKGIVEFVKAAATVKKRYPDARFALLGALGTGNPAEISKVELDTWIDEGVVEYWGISKDVRNEIAQASWIVLPSYREGVPKTLLEAASMGRPLIATDVPGCREIVKQGKNGWLCTAKNIHSLAEVMLKACETSLEQRYAYGEYSRYLAESQFSDAIILSRYAMVLDSLKKMQGEK